MKSRWRAAGPALGIVLVLLFAMRTPILTALAARLILSETPQKADAALVLAGDGSGQRILAGAELVRDGYAPLLLVSGPGGEYGNHECDLAIPFAVKHGYPESYFAHMEHEARSTAEEAQVLLPEIRHRGYHRILLVTSNYHTRRAARIFRSAAPDLTFIVIAAPDDNFTPEGWWHNREAEKTFLAEWEKMFANWLGI